MAQTAPNEADRIGRRLRLRDLRVLTEVVRCGSMAKAAVHLAMSQPTVSEAIASLERAVGVRLLDRHAQGVEATPYAEVLIKRGRAAFDELRQGLLEIEFLANPTIGEVRIACPEFVAAGLLPGAIATFAEQHPGVVFHLMHQDTTTLNNHELQDRSVDLILNRLPPDFVDDDFRTEELFHDPHWIIVGLKSPWATRRKVRLEQLCDERWILPPSPLIQKSLEANFEIRGSKPPKIYVSSASLLLRTELLATGRFVSVMHASTLARNAKVWGLKRLNVDIDLRSPPISLVTLRRRTPTPVVERFMKHLRMIAASAA
ncbi:MULTISPECIES: LysR family transcriptional regulator [Pseudomonadota]|uniref:LysR family transcriptional regulator n=1 Tax=Stutzerimonas stutzeri TaxID=316 RepID=A0A2N8SZ88_STUST|nr:MULTISPECIES: LysR family transcriptional regulator [Pseudomonadota]MCQ4249803.1 LysR family transcriptional regulator [Stutzerimonas stutzeri]PNG07811.1 LysR family transcriptional regulator [Stutzerimonas stutzeri]PNG59703.1 HTH-type transcriptional regulator GltC [Variovorax sp. B4]PNG60506.1 HTH-type transcriptional regulator GltC [Variovorax sp. B2]VTV13610.1 HTH-type transcriptional regulator GltC [Variovorax sp. WDL1]